MKVQHRILEILKQSRQERGILAFYDNVDDASCFIGYQRIYAYAE